MKRKSIQQKLTRSYLLLILAVTLLMLVGFLGTIWLSTLPNARLTMQSTLTELENRISSQMASIERAADAAFLDLNDLDSALLFDEGANSLQKYNQINQSLYLLRQVYADVDRLFLFDLEGQVYADNSLLEDSLRAQFDAGLHAELDSRHGKTYSFGLRNVPAVNGEAPVLLVGKLVRYISNARQIGYLYVTADAALLDTLYSERMICAGQRIYLCDDAGKILSSTEAGAPGAQLALLEDGSESFLLHYDGRLWLRRQAYVESVQATVVLLLPVFELYRGSLLSILVILISAFAGLGLALYESAVITRRLLNPLKELTERANEIRAGNMQLRCADLLTDDETGQLASSLNSMLDRIEALVEQLGREQKETLRRELAVQQNRIQPHFLYNTLNSISALCEMGQLEEAADLAQLVAQYYRRVLSDGKDLVSMEQELRHVELYLQLVKASRGEALRYSIRCDESARQLPIPKLTLQPLVENAVKHAFKAPEGNAIDVSAAAQDGCVTVLITDNGVGMDEKLFEQIVQNRCEGHFGIFSVNERLRLLCGENYSLRAKSAPGHGTQIILRYDTARISENYSPGAGARGGGQPC